MAAPASTVNQLTQSVGFNIRAVTVTQVDASQGIALAVDQQNVQVTLPLFVTRAGARPARAGEQWLIDQSLGMWTFAALIGNAASPAASDAWSVRDFGARGDGSNDDAPAFQAALNAVQAAPGARLTIPVGTYLLKSTVTVKSPVWIDAVPGATIKRGNTAMTALLTSPAATVWNGVYGIRISGGRWDVDGGTLTGGCSAFVFPNTKDLRIERAVIANVRDLHGIHLQGCLDTTIDDVVFEGFTSTNQWTSEAILIDLASDNTTCANLKIMHCTVRDFGGLRSYGRMVGNKNAVTGIFHNKIRVLHNHAVTLTEYMVALVNTRDILIDGNQCSQSNGGVWVTVPTGSTSEVETTTIVNNTFRDMGIANGNVGGVLDATISATGISGEAIRHYIVANNTIRNYANVFGIKVSISGDCEVIGNIVRHGTGASGIGILISGSQNAVVSNNKVADVPTGIQTQNEGAVSGIAVQVVGNSVDACATQAIRASAARTMVNNNRVRSSGSNFSVVLDAVRCMFVGNYVWDDVGSGVKALGLTSNSIDSFVAANYFAGWGTVDTDNMTDLSGGSGISSTERYSSNNA
jgi:polygalacturonase